VTGSPCTSNPRHQHWARAFIELITDTRTGADAARAAGRTQLSGYQQRRIRRRWNNLCDQATGAAPAPPPGLHLYGTNKDARLLALALTEHCDLFLAYTRDWLPTPPDWLRQAAVGISSVT